MKRELFMGLLFFEIAMVQVLSYYFHEQLLNGMIMRFFVVLVFLVFTLTTAKISKGSIRIPLSFCFIIMLYMSLPNKTDQTPVLTLFAIFSLIIAGTFANVKLLSLDTILHAFKIVSICSIPLIIIQIIQADLSIDNILSRGLCWTELFAYATILNFWPVFVAAAFVQGKNLKLAIFVWFLEIIVQLLFLKRAVVVDSTIMLLLLLLFSNKMESKREIKRLVGVLLPFIVIIVILGGDRLFTNNVSVVTQAVSDRFEASSEDLSTIDRFVESINYFTTEAQWYDIVLGRGFLGVHHGLGSEAMFLHIGWLNFLFKGGIPFFLLMLVGFGKSISCVKRFSYAPKIIQFSIIVCLYYGIELFYVNLMGFNVSLFFIFFCMCLISDYLDGNEVVRYLR